MTDPVETSAPERVYLDGDATIYEGYWPRCFGTPKPCSEPALEYIRADLVAALVADETTFLIEGIREAIRLAGEPHYGDKDSALDNYFEAVEVLRKLVKDGR